MSIDPDKPLFKLMEHGVQLPAIDSGGELRVLACLPPRLQFFAPSWRESGLSSGAPLRECDWRHMCGPVLDQDGLGACVGYSGASAFEQAWNAAGFPSMQFSPDFAYACVNGGRDGGAVLSDMIASMASNGMAPEGSIPDYTYKMTKIPQSVRDAAKLHKAAKYLSLSTYDDICDAINNGYAASGGITVGGRFTTLDAGGVSGFGLPRGGHALHFCGLKLITAGRYSGQWGILTKNSWTTDFGDEGYCYLVEAHFDRSVDAYAIQAPQNTDPGLVNPPSPILV